MNLAEGKGPADVRESSRIGDEKAGCRTRHGHMKVLIADDSIVSRHLLEAMVRRWDYQPVMASDGAQAWNALQQEDAPRLAILDWMMPGMTGLEICRGLRQQDKAPYTYVLLLTSRNLKQDLIEGMESGADDYITKPFDFQELHLRVYNALQRTTLRPPVNRVTNLPQGRPVDERLEICLSSQDWSILSVSVENLDAFQESYGFIAAEDALRAIGLIVESSASKESFIGHISDTRIIVIWNDACSPVVKERLQKHLDEKIDFFYPLDDIQDPGVKRRRLSIHIACRVAAQGPFSSLAVLKEKLFLKED